MEECLGCLPRCSVRGPNPQKRLRHAQGVVIFSSNYLPDSLKLRFLTSFFFLSNHFLFSFSFFSSFSFLCIFFSSFSMV